jgi:hypothetical protein
MYEQFSVKFLINYNCKRLYLSLEDEGYINVLNKSQIVSFKKHEVKDIVQPKKRELDFVNNRRCFLGILSWFKIWKTGYSI